MTIKTAAQAWAAAVPERIDVQCGYCGRSVAMDQLGPVITSHTADGPAGRRYARVHTSYLCPRTECRLPTLGFFSLTRSRDGVYVDGQPNFFPRGRPVPMKGLHEDISRDRGEAWSCFYGLDYRAAIIMGRAAIQRAVRTLEAQGNGLYAEINDLADRHKITEALKDAAHEVRISGNDAAHPEDLGVVTAEEAQESLEFMDDFLEHAVAMPERAKARKQARSQTA